jgi:RHS repeat-associated protein
VLKDARATYTPGISERAGTTSKFYHSDALGSTRGITNSSQTVTDAVLYDAFGMTVSRTGTTATPFGFVGAQGYQSDSDSGLQLLGHRYYDPSIGRFLSSDPIQDGDNWYAYCDNNPLEDVDPEGTQNKGGLPGVPWDPVYGPSGEPKVHIIRHPNRKRAKDAARDSGGGPPELHRNDREGRPPHFHPVDHRGRKLPGPHHQYPRRGPAVPKVPKEPEGGAANGSGGTWRLDPGSGQGGGGAIWGGSIVSEPEPLIGGGGGTSIQGYWLVTCGDYLGSCLEAGTLVVMADGSRRRIELIKSGDRILTRNSRGRGTVKATVISRSDQIADGGTAHITVVGGDVIKATENHPIRVLDHGFVRAGSIRPGMKLEGMAGRCVTVVGVGHSHRRPRHIYNLYIGDTHTFYVGVTGILVRGLSPRAAAAIGMPPEN